MELKKYFNVLKACDNEPGFKEDIAKETGLKKDFVEKVLSELESEGLVYKEKENIAGKDDYFWASTAKGIEVLKILEEKNGIPKSEK